MSDIYEGPLFETFGTTTTPPTSRPFDTKGEPVEIPYNELHDGLKQVEVHLYGDVPLLPFVHVVATTQERADAIFDHVLLALTSEVIGKMVD
jgi:hypothetical protein